LTADRQSIEYIQYKQMAKEQKAQLSLNDCASVAHYTGLK